MYTLTPESLTVHLHSKVSLFTVTSISLVFTALPWLISYLGVTILPLDKGLLGVPVVRGIPNMVVTRPDHHLG